MSTAKMLADSTQSDVLSEPQSKSRKKKNVEKKARKSKKSGKKVLKKKTAKEDDILLNDPDLDLTKEVKDISEYIKDRQEMVNQMFNAVQGASLHRALPHILKDLSLETLQQKCVEHLEVMSKKRIRRILNGDDPAAISSSGTEDESTDNESARGESKETTSQVADSTSQAGEQSSQDLLLDATEENYNDEVEMEGEESDAGEWRAPPLYDGSEGEYEDIEVEEDVEAEKEIQEASDEEDIEEVEEETELDQLEEAREKIDADDASNDSKEGSQGSNVEEELEEEVTETLKKKLTETQEAAGESLIPMLTKNQMELLELEMRARAIKAMLKKHQGVGKTHP